VPDLWSGGLSRHLEARYCQQGRRSPGLGYCWPMLGKGSFCPRPHLESPKAAKPLAIHRERTAARQLSHHFVTIRCQELGAGLGGV
jgi:hypothetical protein